MCLLYSDVDGPRLGPVWPNQPAWDRRRVATSSPQEAARALSAGRISNR